MSYIFLFPGDISPWVSILPNFIALVTVAECHKASCLKTKDPWLKSADTNQFLVAPLGELFNFDCLKG